MEEAEKPKRMQFEKKKKDLFFGTPLRVSEMVEKHLFGTSHFEFGVELVHGD